MSPRGSRWGFHWLRTPGTVSTNWWWCQSCRYRSSRRAQHLQETRYWVRKSWKLAQNSSIITMQQRSFQQNQCGTGPSKMATINHRQGLPWWARQTISLNSQRHGRPWKLVLEEEVTCYNIHPKIPCGRGQEQGHTRIQSNNISCDKVCASQGDWRRVSSETKWSLNHSQWWHRWDIIGR